MNATLPGVSVIIPTYNRYPLVCRAIESVLDQSYGNIECIVVDDCSEDNTYEKLNNKYKNKINLFRNEINSEKSFSRNRGYFKSTGNYICFLDSDDTLTVDSVKNRMAVFFEDPEFDGVSFGLRAMAEKAESVAKKLPILKKGGNLSLETYLKHRNLLSTNSFLVPRKNILEFDNRLTNNEDFELFIRMFVKFEFRFCGHIVTKVHRDSINRARDDNNKIIKQGTILSSIIGENPDILKKLGPLYKEIQKKEYAELLRAYYYNRDYKNYKKFYINGKKKNLSPVSIKFYKRYILSCFRYPKMKTPNVLF